MNVFSKGPGDRGPTLRMAAPKNWLSLGVGRIVGGIVLLILLWSSVTSVPTGHVGVLTLFGRVTGDVLDEGIHMINPLKVNNKLSIQTQSIKESASVPSNEGLIIALDTSLIFKLDRDRKSTRLNSSHGYISYAVFCLKKKKKKVETNEVIEHESRRIT